MKPTLGVIFFLMLVHAASATTISNVYISLMRGMAWDFESYAKEHNGHLPEIWSEVWRGFQSPDYLKDVENDMGASVLTKVTYFPNGGAKLNTPMPVDIIAMTSFLVSTPNLGTPPPEIGRYIVTRNSYGSFESNWAAEEKIQAALAKAGLTSPPSGPVYQEKKVYDPAANAAAARKRVTVAIVALAVIFIVGWYLKRSRA